METLISLMLFSVAMLGLSGLTTTIIRSNTRSQQITTATVLAQDQLEALRTLDYASVVPSEDVMISNHNTYARSVGVRHNYPAAGMKTVSITVTWGPDATQHQVALQTIITSKR